MTRSLTFVFVLVIVLLFASCSGSDKKNKELHPSETQKNHSPERKDTLLKPEKPKRPTKHDPIDTLKPKMAGHLDSIEILGSKEMPAE
ncbi:hypothetical protein [Maribacter thermophilus]|uniref:hypothetical protein n=1 Tax=Maribacter thermophilus TaxID=1197874 RepID=UPI0006410964|nr:hypothetical protein [Maribacter thermophilus]